MSRLSDACRPHYGQAPLTISRRLDSDETIKVFFDQYPDGFGPRVD